MVQTTVTLGAVLISLPGCMEGTYNRNYQPNTRAYERERNNINRVDPSYTQRLIQRDLDGRAPSAGLQAGNDDASLSAMSDIENQVVAAREAGFDAQMFLRDGSVRPRPDANSDDTGSHTGSNTDPHDGHADHAAAVADADSGVYLPDGDRRAPTQSSEITDDLGAQTTTDRQSLIVSLFDATATKAQSEQDPFAAMLPVALLGLDTETSQSAGQLDPTSLNNLTPEERTMLEALRTVGRSLVEESVLDRSPGSLANVLTSVARDLSASEPIAITDAALCTRIFGYGRYEGQPGNRFVAGRPNRVSIYTELDHFGTRESRSNDAGVMPGDTIASEVSQTVVLFSGGIQAWSVPKQSVVLPGKKPQRDLFLRQVVDLPANLTIGKYELKVIVRDETDGSVAETLLPLEIVASMGE